MKNVNNEMLLDYIDFTPNEFEELMQQPKMYSKEEEHLIKIETNKKVKELFASLGYQTTYIQVVFCIKFIIDLQAHISEGVGLLYCHKLARGEMWRIHVEKEIDI